MTIFVDSREKARAIKKILAQFDAAGVTHISNKLYVGDYQNLDNPRLVVDRKQSLLEVAVNVCQDHDRFIAELKRAQAAGIRLVFLVEHGGGIRTLDDVKNWVNPRLKESPLAMSGPRLHKILSTLSRTFGVTFLFCAKSETGRRIIEILSTEPEGGNGGGAVTN